ncbi:MAG: hypothetical protein VX353_04030 [Actinomycetota bacterium]
MPKNDTLPKSLQKREHVRAAIDLKGVPEGTSGKIILSNGLDWVRYWVAFDNGVELGSLHRDKLVRASEWNDYLTKRDLVGDEVTESIEAPVAESDSQATSTGGGVEVNGVLVPQLLIDRTQAALERFGVTR